MKSIKTIFGLVLSLPLVLPVMAADRFSDKISKREKIKKHSTNKRHQTMSCAYYRVILTFLLVLSGLAICSAPWAGTSQAAAKDSKTEATADAIGPLPASYVGELPGASSPIAWHLDLLPEGRYQLRTIYLDQPEPNRFDDIGRWTHESDTGRIVLRSEEAPIFLLPVDAGAALRKLDRLGKPIKSSQNDRLTRLPEAALLEPQLTLTGMFTYMADAANIVLCADNQRLPVAMEGDYVALETAYRQTRLQPGKPILVKLEGLLAERPSMEEDRPARRTLVVKRFLATWPREGCGDTPTDSPLDGTYWKLVRLGDSPALSTAKEREAHLIFAADTLRVSGSGGCNRVMGSFELDGDQLLFSRMATTMMACPSGMDQEKSLLESLERVERYRIQGNHLGLMDATGTEIIQFEASVVK